MLQAESVVHKHESISHFKGKMPSFISSFPHDNQWVSTRYHKRNFLKLKKIILLVLDVASSSSSSNALPYTNGI